MTQQKFLGKLLENKDMVVVGSLGTISNDLDKIEYPNKILVRGGMGTAMAVGLGYALNTNKMVVVVIGDGSLLMKAGSLSTILQYKLKNLKVIILNNNCYKSCGGQETNFKHLWSVISLPRQTFSMLDISEQ